MLKSSRAPRGFEKIEWAIFADGFQAGDTERLEFNGFEESIFGGVTARGMVLWQRGLERTKWSFSSSGELNYYCYSW